MTHLWIVKYKREGTDAEYLTFTRIVQKIQIHSNPKNKKESLENYFFEINDINVYKKC